MSIATWDASAARDVLKVGLPASVSPFISNGNIIVLTGYARTFGTVALAGYGIGARLEYLLIPLAFGFGAALLSMVGRNIGAGQQARAATIAWRGSLMVGAITGAIGLLLAVLPDLWTRWFVADATSPVRAVAMAMSSLTALFVVIGTTFLVYALVPAVAFVRGAWDESSSDR